jgi:hypothetical protein
VDPDMNNGVVEMNKRKNENEGKRSSRRKEN